MLSKLLSIFYNILQIITNKINNTKTSVNEFSHFIINPPSIFPFNINYVRIMVDRVFLPIILKSMGKNSILLKSYIKEEDYET